MLNDRARAILTFIQDFARRKGMPPTIREIGEAFDIASTNGVRYHLALLEKAGHIRRSDKISRGLELVGAMPPVEDTEGFGIPILGRVAAGAPILAEEHHEGELKPNEFFGNRDGLFALRVRGDSMIEAGVLEGDYVVVRSQERAVAGEMVVAMIDDEATVKFYRPRGNRVELEPANAKYQPIVVSPDAGFRILGVVKGVIRTVGR